LKKRVKQNEGLTFFKKKQKIEAQAAVSFLPFNFFKSLFILFTSNPLTFYSVIKIKRIEEVLKWL